LQCLKNLLMSRRCLTVAESEHCSTACWMDA
jgi:hypothetical protein